MVTSTVPAGYSSVHVPLLSRISAIVPPFGDQSASVTPVIHGFVAPFIVMRDSVPLNTRWPHVLTAPVSTANSPVDDTDSNCVPGPAICCGATSPARTTYSDGAVPLGAAL